MKKIKENVMSKLNLKGKRFEKPIIALLSVLLIASVFFGGKPIGGNHDLSKFAQRKIVKITKEYVKDNLLSPKTAEVCSKDDMTIYEAKDGIVVSGYVDYKNTFGVEVRQKFNVTLTRDGKYPQKIFFY